MIGGALLILVSSFVFYVLLRKRRMEGKLSFYNLIKVSWTVIDYDYLRTNFNLIFALSSVEQEKLKQEKILYEIEGIATPSHVNSKRKRSNKIETTKYGMHMFSYESIELATDNFSSANKLGEGGFGPVYKVRYICRCRCTLVYFSWMSIGRNKDKAIQRKARISTISLFSSHSSQHFPMKCKKNFDY